MVRLGTPPARRATSLALATLACGTAFGQQKQISFSVDWHGTLQGTLSTGGTPITAADILFPNGGAPAFGPLPVPEIRFTGGFLGLLNYPNCLGAGPGDPCGVEVDALSYGLDLRIDGDRDKYVIQFSTDEYATGPVSPPFVPPPSLNSESGPVIGDSSADVWATVDMPLAPVPPIVLPNHTGMLDGNGLLSLSGWVYRGIGLSEPNRPGQGLPGDEFDEGDNLDAFDLGPVPNPNQNAIFYSLDSFFFDSSAGVLNSNSAAFQGAVGGDVLARLPNGAVVVYAPANVLGLDRNGGPGSDDLDALILAENGMVGYQPSTSVFDWQGGTSDMLLFSVRRGSAVIGQIDSLQGLKIVEGDILTTPTDGIGNPGIFIAAESLGLSVTRGTVTFSDDLNAADAGLEPDPYHDCNNNNTEDAIDIAKGTSCDANMNGIPDECEPPGIRFCFCPMGSSPCSNPDASAGCANSTGVGASLEGSGTSSVVKDDLVLFTSGVGTNQFGLTFMGAGTTSVPLVDGIRCVDPGGVGLFRFPPQGSGMSGTFTRGPGIIGFTKNNFPAAGEIVLGSTWYYQTWYRDPMGPCGSKSNLSNALSVLFTP